MSGIPVDRETFVGADEKTYRSLQYDLFKTSYKKQDKLHEAFTNQPKECEKKFVTWQWIRERKFLLVGVSIGALLFTGGGLIGIAKLLAFL